MDIKLAVLDAAQVIHRGIQDIVTPMNDMAVVGTWTQVSSLVEAMVSGQAIDILILGDNTRSAPIQSVASDIVGLYPKVKIVALTTRITLKQFEALSGLGVMGFMVKDEALGDFFVGALYAVTRGDVYISPQTAHQMFLASRDLPPVVLTPRQAQVLHHMAEYKSPQEIAQHLSTSVSSVYNVQHRLRQVLNVTHTGQILLAAAKHGLIKEAKERS